MFTQVFNSLLHIILISTPFVQNSVWGFTIHPTTSITRKPMPNTVTLRSSSQLEESLSLTENNYTYREIRNISDSHNSMETLANRLHSCGVESFYFANDSDPAEQLAPIIQGDRVDLQHLDPSELRKDESIHVKTLIWKGIFLRNSTSAHRNENKDGEDGDDGDDAIYFVTALRVEDKVDMGKLRMIIKGEMRKKGGQTLILQLAEQQQAESIAGFASGSMPPAWHSVPLKLYIDDYILESYNITQDAQSDDASVEGQINGDSVGDNGSHYSKIMMSVGSGSSTYSLHVSLLDTLMSSVYLDDRIQVCEELGLHVENTCKSHGRFIVPFTRTRADKKNKEKQKMLSSKKSSRLSSIVDRGEKGKDSTDLNKPMKLTRRLFHVTAKKKGKVNEVKQMIEMLGDDFPSFMRVDTGAGDEQFAAEHNKSAVHYAAWKGDIETVTLLLNECKRFQDEIGDAFNTISTGEGCYGKSPIFYAITQCRDDMVLHLLALGATLLIVNNKGQSPCSLAINKLKPGTCRLMYQTEEAQLKAGGEFADYRRSHSDGRRYGDLDPRFLEVGDINMDYDIQAELDQFEEYNTLECDDAKKAMSESNPFLLHSIPEQCLPRSVRVTNPAMRQAIRTKDQVEKRKQKLGEQAQLTGLSLLRSVRVTTPIWMQEAWLKKQEEKQQNSHLLMEEKSASRKEKTKNKSARVVPNHIVKLDDGTEIDMNSLENLKLEDVLQCASNGEQKTYELVDCDAGILALDFAVEETLDKIEGSDAHNMNDDQIVSSSWGLDCEWRPSFMSGEMNPVATLQLSSSSRSFVIDVQTLCQGGVATNSTQLKETEKSLSETLSKLFLSRKIRIIGFGITQDLSKLAASFPHIPCFHELHSVLDLQSLSRFAYPRMPKQFMSSLQKATSIILRKRMDKTEQCSEWNSRPLRNSQLEYASLDATILPVLLDKMLYNNPDAGKEKGFFLRKNSGQQSSYRFTFLDDDGNYAYRIAMGSVKTSVELKVARQMWPTFSRKDSPPLPEKVPPYEVKVQFPTANESKKEKAIAKKKRSHASKVKRNAIELTQLNVDTSNLSLTGKELGYTKDSCIEQILTKEVIESLPEDSYLRYNRRGGIIEIGNCWMLFVNFTVGRFHEKFRNEFHHGGKLVSFTINPSRCKDGELLQNLLIPEVSSMSRKSVFLFMRGSNKEKFIC